MNGRSGKAWKCAGAGLVVAATAAIVLAAGGLLDTTFGTGGVAAFDTGFASAGFGGLAVQTDGKTVECGWTNTGRVNEVGAGIWEWQIRRFTAVGALDGTFGSAGLVRLFGDTDGGTGPVSTNKPRSVAQDAAGRTLVVGNSAIKTVTVTGTGKKATTTYSWKQYATLARLDANGTLDASFGSGGVVRTAVPGAAIAAGYDLALQPDGRIVIAAMAYTVDSSKVGGYRYEPFIARYLADGSLDASLGTGGIAVDTRPISGSAFPGVAGIALQSTGQILVAETRGVGNLWAVTRFTGTGAMDTGFATPAIADRIYGIAVDRFDRIVATGQTPSVSAAYDMRVARYLPDGSADSSFGSGGIVIVNAYQRDSAQSSARFQVADDKIVFGAAVGPVGSASQVATSVRLTDAGVLDSAYGSGGLGALITGSAGFNRVALAPDGGIVLGGVMFTPNSSLWLARCLGN